MTEINLNVEGDKIETPVSLAVELQKQGRKCSHRRMLVLSGEREWCQLQATEIFKNTEKIDRCWVGDGFVKPLPGQELDLVVFNAWSGFDPDVFGAMSGCLRGGGLLLLLIPPVTQWKDYEDPHYDRIRVALSSNQPMPGRYLRRLLATLQADSEVSWCEQEKPAIRSIHSNPQPLAVAEYDLPYKSRDQQEAVAAVVNVVRGHRRRPVVLSADRGRGKSAAFGLAAAELIRAGAQKILVTGPGRLSVEAVFQHAQTQLNDEQMSALEFVAPDELIRNPKDAGLLLVDEAAAIPAPLLETLLKRYSRIAFSTTAHGYEGTGRGFAMRFHRVLDQNAKGWKTKTLKVPVRWAVDDPLESLVFRMLLLDAQCVDEQLFEAGEECSFERLDRGQLAQNEQDLGELFGLLVSAHYKTRPFDLRQLLDGPNVEVFVARSNGHIAAVVLTASEGGFEVTEAKEICAGKRRPRGHLLPEILAAQLGLEAAPLLRCVRVMRIAVHPALRRRKIASQLLEQVADFARSEQMDYIGASFGLDEELLQFWNANHWRPVWLSTQRNASSGCHSAVFMRALSGDGLRLQSQASTRFFAHFPHQLADHLNHLEPALVCGLLKGGKVDHYLLDEDDWRDAYLFSFEQRMLEVCIGAIWKLVMLALSSSSVIADLQPEERNGLVLRVVQKRSWQDVASYLKVAGRKQALEILRKASKKLYLNLNKSNG